MLRLTVGFSKNPRIEPLIDRTIKPQNIELAFVSIPPTELFYRNLKYDEFDIFEMSISEFLMTKEKKQDERWEWIGLPVFLSKAFMFLDLYFNPESKIEKLADLKGKRTGVPDYPMTSALWLRTLLRELYGIKPVDIIWYNGRTREFSHGALLGLDKNTPPGILLNWLTEEQTFDLMLARGELDVAYGFVPPSDPGMKGSMNIDRYGGVSLVENSKLQRLLPDYGRQVIMEFFRKTGILPTNHMVAVQKRVVDEYPWVALELYKAFEKAKQTAYDRASRLSSTYLLFEGDDAKIQAATIGDDPFPLGIEKNKKMLEILFQSSHEQGLTKNLKRIEDVFFPSTLDT
jgi:4,5-dihydroxyphthalate decarboxylase